MQHDSVLTPLAERLVQGGLEEKVFGLLRANMDAGMAGQQQATQQQAQQQAGNAVLLKRMDGVVAEFGASAAMVSDCSSSASYSITPAVWQCNSG